MAQQEERPLRLLSLDGGGIRGLSELFILGEIMNRLAGELKLEKEPIPADYFDLIGGTSTGGLIALLLGRLKLSVPEAMEAYRSLAKNVFGEKKRFSDGKFNEKALEQAIKDTVKTKLGDAEERMLDPESGAEVCKAFVCSVQAQNIGATAGPRRFRTYHVHRNKTYDCKIWEAGRATSAAPTFFPRILIGPEGAKQEYVDAGIGYNNPVKEVIDEASRVFGEKRKVKCIVSIGTGQASVIKYKKPGMFEKALPFKLAKALASLSTDCDRVAEEVEKKYRDRKVGYWRLNVNKGLDGISFEEWDKLGDVETYTQDWVATEIPGRMIDEIVAALIAASPTSTLGTLERVNEKHSGLYNLGQLLGNLPARNRVAKTIVMCPYSRNTKFVGREHILEGIRQQLPHEGVIEGQQTARTVAIYGLGGVGKSQIALEYLFWVHETYPDISIFWIHAATPERFREGYLEIGRRCGIRGLDDQTKDILQLVKDWLEIQSHGKWFMVIDNADDEKEFFHRDCTSDLPSESPRKNPLYYYLPQCPHGSILVTTRVKTVAYNFTMQYDERCIEATAMNKEESRALLQKLIPGEKSDSDIDRLAELLYYLPLALAQAGAFIRCSASTIEKYIKSYQESEESAVKVLNREFQSDGRHLDAPNAVATSWMLSFDQIRAHAPRAAEILSLMAFFDRQAVPESLLKNDNEDLSDFETAIGNLMAYSLITRNVDDTFDEHRLAHLISGAWLKRHEQEENWAAIAQKRILNRFPKEDYKDWDLCASYLPHARAVIDKEMKKESRVYVKCINYLMSWAGRFLHVQGSYLLAIEIHQRRLDYCTNHLGEMHLNTLDSMNNLALAFGLQGQYSAAEKLYQQVLAGTEKVLGPEHPSTLTSVNNLAEVFKAQGRYPDAEKLHRRTLASRERVLGSEHLDTLRSVNNLASVLKDQGKYSDAEQLYRRAIMGFGKILGPEHPFTLSSQNNLAVVFLKQRNYKAAEELLRGVIISRENILGPKHPDTLGSVHNLARALFSQKQYLEVEQLYRRALLGKEEVLGVKHPHTTATLENMVATLRGLGRINEAEELEKEWAMKQM